ncbi:hypothetical protein KQX54_018480 [Cotesia glomerata]|uniref:Uncharacterized protein n=1 Tax=Cotesia glomerata TaxID=32391 RepID=A0AAV7HYD1_COTGL|nr:hypothetical protein KQX54_018480 [Cotesia glomerata]
MVPIPFAFSSQHRSSRVLSHTSRSIALPPNTAIQGFLCFLPLYSRIRDKRPETRKGRIRVIPTVQDIHLKKDKDHWLMLLQLLFHSPRSNPRLRVHALVHSPSNLLSRASRDRTAPILRLDPSEPSLFSHCNRGPRPLWDVNHGCRAETENVSPFSIAPTVHLAVVAFSPLTLKYKSAPGHAPAPGALYLAPASTFGALATALLYFIQINYIPSEFMYSGLNKN